MNPRVDERKFWRKMPTSTSSAGMRAGSPIRISHIGRSDGWIETTWNNMSDPGAFAAAGTEEQEGGEPPPVGGAGIVVCLMG
jgi:hypothetical protein